MCQIFVCEKRKPTEHELTSNWQTNPDGAGVGWYKNGKVLYVKGIESIEELKKHISKLDLPFVIHMRLTSSGGKTKYLTHPFVINENFDNPLRYEGTNSILFHNGTVNEAINLFYTYCMIKNKKLPKHYSDTFCLAKLISVLGVNLLRKFNHTNRFCIITTKKIIKIGNFTEKDGIYFSSSFYTYNYNYYNYNHFKDDCPYKNNYQACIYKNYRECRFVNRNCIYQRRFT